MAVAESKVQKVQKSQEEIQKLWSTLRSSLHGELSPVPVKAIKDLFWSDGNNIHLHVKKDEIGVIYYHTNAGFLVKFEKETRQVFDFRGEKEYRAEDEIVLLLP